jgi:hypothetical protein
VSARLAWGAAAIAAYLAASFALGGVPLYDGLAPNAPYLYVDPPPDLADDNQPPLEGTGVIDIVGRRSAASSVTTGDGQAQFVFPTGVFAARGKEKVVEITIVPIKPSPPIDLGGDTAVVGNAYRVQAVYETSRDRAPAREEMTAILRYPFTGSYVVRREGNLWRRLESENSQASLQLFAQTDELGTFAAAGPPHRIPFNWIPYAAGAAGVAVGALGYVQSRRMAKRRKQGGRAARRRAQRRSKPH